LAPENVNDSREWTTQRAERRRYPGEEPFFDVRCLTSLSTFWSQSRGSRSTRRASRTPVMYDWEAISTEGGGVKPNPKRSSRLRYMDFRRSPRSKAIPWGIAVGFVLISGLYLGLPIRHLDDRVYLIGWQNSPPFQQRAVPQPGWRSIWCATRPVDAGFDSSGYGTREVRRPRCGTGKWTFGP